MTAPTAKEVAAAAEWVACRDRCADPAMHAFYAAGGRFQWVFPQFNVTRPADTRPRFVLNRYPHNVIGAAVIVFRRGWGVRWKGSAWGRPRKASK